MNVYLPVTMSESFSITNVYSCYVDNRPYLYPSDDVSVIYAKDSVGRKIDTGYHVIPNLLWSHMCTPKQWAELCIQFEAYHVESIKATLFNPVPITTNIAIQRTNLFAAFNNCTYMWGYTDDLYETSYHPWLDTWRTEQPKLAFKEGLHFYGDMGSLGSESATAEPTPGPGGTTDSITQNYKWTRYRWPPYYWRRPDCRTASNTVWGQGIYGNGVYYGWNNDDRSVKVPIPGGIFWDPLNRPDHIQELRAGKNSMSFEWNCAPCDEHVWYNIDQIAAWAPWTQAGPYCGGKRPGTYLHTHTDDPDQLSSHGLAQANANGSATAGDPPQWHDYTIPDFGDIPVVANNWFWMEMKNSIIDRAVTNLYLKPDKYWCGTEAEKYKYPPTQWFVKGIPLYDTADNLIKTSTQVSFKITLNLQCKKRRSALYAPTWGPFAGKQLYHANSKNHIFQPTLIRYRTAGMRRTWQNEHRQHQTVDGVARHPREDPYQFPTQLYPWDTALPDYTHPPESAQGKNLSKDIVVTFKAGEERVVFQKPTAPSRRGKQPEKSADIQMMEDIQMGP